MRTFQKINLAQAIQLVEEHQSLELTFGELVAAFNATRYDGTSSRLKKWIEAFGNESAWSIASERLEMAAHAMVDHGYSPASANRDLSSIGSVYKWAKRRRICPRGFVSPTVSIRRFEESLRRVYVEDTKIEQLKKIALTYKDRRFGVFVHLLFETGARKSELLKRTWDSVDLERRELLAPTTKNTFPRVLFFSEQTAALIKRVYPHRNPHKLIFEGRVPGEPIDYRYSWEKLRKSLELEDLHIHDTRHVSSANLLKAGVTLPVAAQVIGNSPAMLARRYGHLETAALKTAQETAWKRS